jgi:hypothetical protein
MIVQHLPSECQALFETTKIDCIQQITPLRQRDDHGVYRVKAQNRSFVLKYFQTPIHPKEIQVYALLQKHGVPTLPCYAMTDNCILLEDLLSSLNWRLADPVDLTHWNTGQAVANWYSKLHAVGYELLHNAARKPDFLQPWVASISPDALKAIEADLGSEISAGWKLALSNCEVLKTKYLSFPQTFNYNDFAAENLALSRGEQDTPKAIVYDYDQFSSGVIYSDWRNVTYSLQGKARNAFMDCFGTVNEHEQRLDDVLSILSGLLLACARKVFPHWAFSLRESIFNGDLERKIKTALENIDSL